MNLSSNNSDKRWCLYCHTNKTNGKKYYGITCQKPERRWQNGYGYRTKYFFNAIRKYGWDGFIHEILISGLTLDEANQKEKEYIRKDHTCIYDIPCNGYNATYGGDGCEGYRHSDETREKFRKRIMSQETRRKIAHSVSLANQGRVVSEETKQKISASTKGRVVSQTTRKKISEAQVGKIMSAAQKEKISRQHIENPRYNSRCVLQIDKKTGKVINSFFSTGEAKRVTGINNIRACCSGKQKTAGGHKWKYADEVIYE